MKTLTRREFLRLSAMTAAGVAAAACAQPTPMVIEKEVIKEVEVEKPVIIKEEVIKEVPVEKIVVVEKEVIKEVEVEKVVEKEVIKEVRKVSSRQAPELQELVKAGKLPPLEERLPVNPLVLKPIHGIGQYGGRIRSFSTSVGVQWEESQYGHSPLRWIDDGLGIAPGMVGSWSTNADNSEWTLNFRKGLKWSDGQPCTVDDVLYWWNDLVLNLDHKDNPPDFGQAAGKLVELIRVDDYTLKLKYAAPSPLTVGRLAMWVNSEVGPRWIAPRHYLEQFHPDYSDATDFEEHDEKMMYRQNPDCPALTSWICGSFEPGLRRTWVRNPYYYAVDTEGDQLPYINGVDEIAIADDQTKLLTILQGGADFVSHILYWAPLSELSTLKEGQEEGNYVMHLWDCGGGTGSCFFFNNDNPEEEKRALYRNPTFKQAISHCIDRDTIQKVVYYGTGEKTTGTHSPKCREFTFSDEAKAFYIECRDAHVTYDLDLARKMLDEAGVVDQNGDGFRQMASGAPLEFRIDFPADIGADSVRILEIVTPAWKEAGLNVIQNPMPPAEFGTMWEAGLGEFRYPWGVGDGPNHLLYPSWLVPNEPARWSPLSGRRLMLVGTEKEDTELDKSPWDRDPPRYASTERELIGEAVWKLQEIYQEAIITTDEVTRHHMVWDLLRIHKDLGPFFIGTVANRPLPTIVNKDLINVPSRDELALHGFICPWIIPSPAITNPETYAYKNPEAH